MLNRLLQSCVLWHLCHNFRRHAYFFWNRMSHGINGRRGTWVGQKQVLIKNWMLVRLARNLKRGFENGDSKAKDVRSDIKMQKYSWKMCKHLVNMSIRNFRQNCSSYFFMNNENFYLFWKFYFFLNYEDVIVLSNNLWCFFQICPIFPCIGMFDTSVTDPKGYYLWFANDWVVLYRFHFEFSLKSTNSNKCLRQT